MQFLRGVFTVFNRPLPAWATLFLFFGVAAAAAAPAIYDASLVMQVNGVGRELDHSMQFQNSAASKPDAADSVAVIQASAARVNTECHSRQPVSQMWPGIVGSTAGNYGGYWVFWTKNDGTCSGNEVLVLDAQQHLYMPNDESAARFTTPSTCTSRTTCTTWTWTFAEPFLTISGGTQVPRCSALGISDESDSTQTWVGNIRSVSSKQIVYNIVPMLSTGTSHTLDVYATCHDQSY